MINYIPFVKFKQNEIQAIATLDKEIASKIRPMFDVPRPSKNMNEAGILERIALGKKHLDKATESLGSLEFYIDNYDLDESITLKGDAQYRHLLHALLPHKPIPVAGIERSASHNNAALGFAAAHTGKIALRIQKEDLESYAASKARLETFYKAASQKDLETHTFIDLRIISDADHSAAVASRFIKKLASDFGVGTLACTGSIIPANISDLIATKSQAHLERLEFTAWLKLRSGVDTKLIFGDYGVVSPDYSDAELDPRILRQVSTPKAFYPYSNLFFVTRGSSLEKHPQGNGQYFDIADDIAKLKAYRNKPYSFGDEYIHDRSYLSTNKPNKAGSPGSWVKATLAAHITYIVRNI